MRISRGPRNGPRSRLRGKSSRRQGNSGSGHGNGARRTIHLSLLRWPPASHPGSGGSMKVIRWAAAAALTLISLMNIGVVLGSDESTPIAVSVLVPVLGGLGNVAGYGL